MSTPGVRFCFERGDARPGVPLRGAGIRPFGTAWRAGRLGTLPSVTLSVSSRSSPLSPRAGVPFCLVDADLALEWAQANAPRWLGDDPLAGLDLASPPARVRAALDAFLDRLAALMRARVAPSPGDAPCPVEPLREWLCACFDAVAELDGNTVRGRLIPPLGSRAVLLPALRPLRRWTAVLREHLQGAGIRWVRARSYGPCSFRLATLDGVCAVLEDGWPDDEDQLRVRIILAAAAAVARHPRDLGRPSRLQAAPALLPRRLPLLEGRGGFRCLNAFTGFAVRRFPLVPRFPSTRSVPRSRVPAFSVAILRGPAALFGPGLPRAWCSVAQGARSGRRSGRRRPAGAALVRRCWRDGAGPRPVGARTVARLPGVASNGSRRVCEAPLSVPGLLSAGPSDFSCLGVCPGSPNLSTVRVLRRGRRP